MSSAAARNLRIAISPGFNFWVAALPWLINNMLAGAAALATPRPVRNERRRMTLSQSELTSFPLDWEYSSFFIFCTPVFDVILFHEAWRFRSGAPSLIKDATDQSMYS